MLGLSLNVKYLTPAVSALQLLKLKLSASSHHLNSQISRSLPVSTYLASFLHLRDGFCWPYLFREPAERVG